METVDSIHRYSHDVQTTSAIKVERMGLNLVQEFVSNETSGRKYHDSYTIGRGNFALYQDTHKVFRRVNLANLLIYLG